MSEETGVTESASPTGTSDGYVTAPGGRTIDNVAGEFSRKFGSLAQKVDQLTNLVAAQIQSQQAPPSSSTTDLSRMSDDQLWDESVKGNKDAFTLREQRIAARTYQALRGAESESQMIHGQVQAIWGKYGNALRDPNHPLTQHINTANALLQRRGRPVSDATWLEAAKTAITDRPDLVSDLHSQTARATENIRRQGTPRQTGAAHRDQPAGGAVQFRTTREDYALAERMGVKDPDAAKRRFLERQQKGLSSFGQVAHNVEIGEL